MKDKCLDCFFYDVNNHVCYNGSDEEPYPCKHKSNNDNLQNDVTCSNCAFNDCCYSPDDCRHLR